MKAQNSANLARIFKDYPREVRQDDQQTSIVRECCKIFPILRDGHLLERPHADPKLLHTVLFHHQHVIPHTKQHFHVSRHGVLRLDHGHAQWVLLDSRISKLARDRILEIGNAEDLEPLGNAHHAVAPENALDNSLLEALLSQGELRSAELGVDIVRVDGAILDDTDEYLIVGPGHSNKAAAGAVPYGGGEGATGSVEDEEFAASGLGVELNDLGVVADSSDGATEGGGGNAVAGEVDATPLHGVDGKLAVEPVVQELPLPGDGYGRHHR